MEKQRLVSSPPHYQAHTAVAIPPAPEEDLTSLCIPAWFTCLLCNCICGGIAIHYANEADNGAFRSNPALDAHIHARVPLHGFPVLKRVQLLS